MSSAPLLTIVVATGNQGKLAELRALLASLPIEVRSTAEVLSEPPTVHENGKTFEDNALIKARAIADATSLITLADDSGLEVDALGGRPGVRSARFSGEGATDASNNALLLESMQDVEGEQRTARFRCAMALVDPWHPDRPVVVDGRCEGLIARTPSGTGGFGYDPLFIVSGVGRTMAELGMSEKNELSHRARALGAMRPEIERIVRERLAEADELERRLARSEAR